MTSTPDFAGDLVLDGAGFSYFRRRSSSLNRRHLQLVFGSLAMFSLLVALAFAAAGAWMLLPFAGAEIAALGMAARWTLRRSGDFERVVCAGDRISVRISEGGRSQEFEFNRCWARLAARDGAIALRSHGREIAIGRFCGEEGRQRLTRELQGRLGGPGI